MSWWYRQAIRPLLFLQDPEAAHHRTMRALAWASHRRFVCRGLQSLFGSEELPVELFGLRFPNPVGLAAGMDKYAEAVPVWPRLGFGFAELGGVTSQAQPGNPRPRLFRAVRDRAIINRMGFNNPGAEALAQTLARWRSSGCWPTHPVGINLGKSKITPLERAAEDYASSFRVLRDHADFFVVNVSSPNTPNLRRLQDKAALDEILAAIQENQSPSAPDTAPRTSHSAKPILIKVAPDLTFEALDDIVALATDRKLAGLVATNTTITRPKANDDSVARIYAETGGLSGWPLRTLSTEIIRHLYRQTRGALPIIGVGGIFNAADAWEKITAGASLVQLYTGLVYEGPGLARAIVRGLRRMMANAGFQTVQQAVGTMSRT